MKKKTLAFNTVFTTFIITNYCNKQLFFFLIWYYNVLHYTNIKLCMVAGQSMQLGMLFQAFYKGFESMQMQIIQSEPEVSVS